MPDSLTFYRRPPIDILTSLRFFACLSIIVHHAGDHNLLPFAIPSSLDLSKSVGFFFVLSGFVLEYAYPRSNFFSNASFYVKRFAKLWPSLVFSIFLVFLILPAGFIFQFLEAPYLLA